jgi:hypothetical protein
LNFHFRESLSRIRKPIAPPSQTLGKAKPEEKAHPARRKTKHKKKEESES